MHQWRIVSDESRAAGHETVRWRAARAGGEGNYLRTSKAMDCKEFGHAGDREIVELRQLEG